MIRESENHTHTRPRLQRCRRLSATCLSPHPHGLATKRASVRAAFSAMTAWETQSTDLLFLSMRPGTCSDSNMALSADICLQTFSLSLSLARPLSLSLSLSLCLRLCLRMCLFAHWHRVHIEVCSFKLRLPRLASWDLVGFFLLQQPQESVDCMPRMFRFEVYLNY